MKKSFYILTLFFLQAIIGSCTDEALYESPENGTSTSVKIALNVPVDNGKTRGLIYGPDEAPVDGESVIADAYALAFDKTSGNYIGKFNSYMSGANSLMAAINIDEMGTNELTVVVLTNLKSLENGNELISKINGWTKGSISKSEALESLEYSFSDKWELSTRPLPMWGETNITPVKATTVTGEVNLYRSVSKINVVVNEGKGRQTADGTDVFRLKSVRVYYARTSGLAGSLHAPVANTEGSTNTIITPSIPNDVNYFPRYSDNGISCLLYDDAQQEGSYAIENRIYVPESDQTQTEEPMCLVVGGYYMGSSEETFYRVDFKEGNKGDKFYNAIRNHIYTFNINNVTRPGTDDPDPALDHVVVGMDVTIKDWTTEWMRGIGGQYTLEVSTGGFILAGNTQNNGILKGELTVTTTHNEGWEIDGQSGNWFTTEQTSTGVIVKANTNNGGERRGSFTIKSGNLKKEITVHQRGKGTANSYIVSGYGDNIQHDLIVTVKGNGEVGLTADGVPLVEKDPYIAVDRIADVQLIWETSNGLVKIVKDNNGKAILDKESGIIKYTVDLNKENSDITASNKLNSQNYKGGNALIGAFGKNEDGSVNYDDLLWTWHIWVCPDIDKDKNGKISDSELLATDQEWATGYTFMDRNMGALSKDPGLPSLGLLYQWGRKDPFIGAAKVNTDRDNKMYTNRPLTDKGYDWKTSAGNMSIEQATKAPTTLIKGTITGTDYKYLWGTASGLNGEANAGNKTIYDPCPHGYRVPNVAAIVFEGTASREAAADAAYKNTDSENQNWYSNNEFWPMKKTGGSRDWPYYERITGQSSYGFWLRYDKHDSEPSITQYSSSNNKNIQTSNDNNRITWLPLSGVYDGDISQLALVSGQNSLLTNSIMWTNSSITVNGDDRPAGLFLHGVQSSKTQDGNHFHKLKESGTNSSALYAKPQHAGALRCVRDVKVNMAEENAIKVPSQIHLAATAGDSKTEELTSLLDSWEVVDPGAMWFVMTPDAGSTGSKQKITFTSTQVNAGRERSAEIKIRFNGTGGGTIKSIRVTQAGLNRADHSINPSAISLTSAINNSAKGEIVAINDTWEIVSGQVNWLSISPMKSASLNDGGTSDVTFRTTERNTSNSARSTTLKVRFGNGEEKTIKVTQAGTYELSVSTAEMDFRRNDAPTQYFNISSNTGWTISANKNWIIVGESSGDGNKDRISVNCNNNDSFAASTRTGTITIRTSDGSIVKEIQVSQRGWR